MVVIISSCLWFSRKGGRGRKEKKERERVQRKCKKGEEEGMREVNVSVWAVTVRYLRAPQRRAQAALVQVLLVCRVMLCLSVCVCFSLTQSHSLSGWLKSEFSFWQVHLDIMNNFNPLNAGMKRKWPYLGIQPLSVRLVLSAW